VVASLSPAGITVTGVKHISFNKKRITTLFFGLTLLDYSQVSTMVTD
jgi:hypothetical protein